MNYPKAAQASSSIWQWYNGYQTLGGHSHKTGNRCPQNGDEKKNKISARFNANPTLFSQNAGAQTGVPNMTKSPFYNKC